ncbi:MAG: hypothetical protein GC201_13130 [Alphaproteobacteria bacterium]|nr:hypothetical protein [Alphaproteobacteria bacterium]
MTKTLATAVLFVFVALGARAQPDDTALTMAPVDEVFSFMGGQLKLVTDDSSPYPAALPSPGEAARFEKFLEVHPDDTLLFVRGDRILRRVTPRDDLYRLGGALPLSDSSRESDRALASEAPDRIEVYAISARLTLTDQITGFEETTGDAGTPAVVLSLSPAASAALKEMTTRHQGQQVATILDRWLLSSPLVEQPLDTDRLVIDVGGQQDPSTRTEIMNILKSLVRPPE